MPSSDLLKPTRRISSLGQLTRGMRHCATNVCFRRKADIRGYRNVSSAAAFSVNEGALFARRMSSDLQRVRRQHCGVKHADAPTDTSHVYDAS
jgi:hypothetical protein